MKKYCMLVFVCLISLAVWTQTSYAVEMGIITGNKEGTYYRFGLDLQELMAQHGIHLTVYPSNGSVDNIYAVYKMPSIQLGIVQSDVLAFVAKVQSNKTLKLMAKRIRVVFPLYDEEVQIVARKGISDFSDLSGRRVAVGEDGSGTYLTAKLLFEASGIKPEEMVNIGTEQALAQLKEGKIDAMFYVAGAPVKLFAEHIGKSDNLQLLPVTNKKILDYYPMAEIPAGTYAWQDKAINTVAVKAVLISCEYRASGCANVCRFARILYENVEQLIQRGHPKWKTVDFHYDVKGWKQYDCVRRILGLPAREVKPAGPNPVLEAIKETLK